MTDNEPLVARARKWIEKNIPAYTRWEYEALLATNEALMLRLIAKCMDYDALLEAHYRLEKEATQGMPFPPMRVDVCIDKPMDMHFMETRTSIRWDVDPYQANCSVADYDMSRYGPGPVMDAFKSMFHKQFVPALWAKTEASMHRAAGQSVRR